MEEESERLKEEERCDVGDMQLLATSPRPGEITFYFYFEETLLCLHNQVYSMHLDSICVSSQPNVMWNRRVLLSCPRYLEELEMLRQVFFFSSTGPFYNMTPEERIDADHRSVYVGNVSCLASSSAFFFFL